jgi:hypothetical protein
MRAGGRTAAGRWQNNKVSWQWITDQEEPSSVGCPISKIISRYFSKATSAIRAVSQGSSSCLIKGVI